MAPRLGRSSIVIIGVLLAGPGLACDWIQLGDPDLPPPTSPGKPVTDAAAAADGYDAMCRHYCQALEETDLLVCVSSGEQVQVNDCKARTPTADSCFDLRCRPRRVDVPLCLTQCDALARFYDAHCPVVGPSSDGLCPTSQADHDAACRAGCVH